MSFEKTGSVFKIASSQVVDLQEWNSFCKEATGHELEIKNADQDKKADFNIVAEVDPENFIYIHSTIMAGVKTGDNGKDYWITPTTEKFINDNHDSWTNVDLLNDHKSFKTATTFLEHDQNLERAKGKCIDVIARQMPDTLLVDVLFSVDKRHEDLVANIQSGIINAVSMGCSTAKTICSICGNEASEPSQYCEHIRNFKGQNVECSDGKIRKVAEICKGNTFFDVSLVANPAFIGAVFRKILASKQDLNHTLSRFFNSKLIAETKDDQTVIKAANSDELIFTFSDDGTINIKTASGKEFKAEEKLSSEHLEEVKKLASGKISEMKIEKEGYTISCTCDAPVKVEPIEVKEAKKEESKGILRQIISKYFGSSNTTNKTADYHPITNTKTDRQEPAYPISHEDYSDIPYNDPHDVLDDFEIQESDEFKQRRPYLFIGGSKKEVSSVEKIARTAQFECFNCGYTKDLWQVKAANIDDGNKEIIECPNCFFKTEADLIEKEAEVSHSITRAIEEDNRSAPAELLNEIEKNTHIVHANLPLEDDEGTYWYNEMEVDRVVHRGSKLAFVTKVENGNYALYRDNDGQDIYLPYSVYNRFHR